MDFNDEIGAIGSQGMADMQLLTLPNSSLQTKLSHLTILYNKYIFFRYFWGNWNTL